MIRIHIDNYVPKYQNGKWLWDDSKEAFSFLPVKSSTLRGEAWRKSQDIYIFRETIDELEELIFRQKFTRLETSFDSDVITIADIKNVVLFLAPKSMLTNYFIKFVNTTTVDRFLRSLITYFNYFLKVYEFLLIRRDEVTEKYGRVQSLESIKIKQMLSDYLSQYRLLAAREYSKILFGKDDMKPFYHIVEAVQTSQTTKDCVLHEMFIAFTKQVVWIAHHRKALNVITNEIDRLLRSDHFKVSQNESKKWKVELQLLYGRNCQRLNYRAQISPLIQEISRVSPRNLPILWIGERKYRGNDKRILQLELETVVPASQLSLIDVQHGILGHPKRFYTTLLNIHWESVRYENYSDSYDPYKIVRQPYLIFPEYDEFKVPRKHYKSYFIFERTCIERDEELIANWLRREKIVSYYRNIGILKDTILECKAELDKAGQEITIEREKIIGEFVKRKIKLRKK